MAGKPLDIDWSQILPGKEADAPPLDLEVVPTPPIPSSTSAFESSSFTDSDLEIKILRLTKILESDFANNLPDKGQKLQANIRACQRELDRRKLARVQPETAEQCETATESKATEPSVTPKNSLHSVAARCDSQSSFFSMFNQKLDKRAGSMSIRKISIANPCQIHERTNSCHMSSHAARVSLRRAMVLPSSKVSSMEEKRSPNANCKSIESSSFYAPRNGRRRSKRSKLFEWRNASILKRKKVQVLQDVVLLEEEDAQPEDPIRYASDERKEAKMYYPSRDHPEAVELSYSDLKCLEPEQFISSSIMNFYIRYLQKPVNKTRGEYYFFNTYFFGKLKEALSSKGDSSLQFSKLRRWWKGVNIFEKAYIFLPIHKDLHWSLVIISIPPKEAESRPIILHLDSLSLHKSLLILEVVQCFLTEEWKFVKQNASSPLKIEKKEIKVPQQKNEYDCGIFVLYFMERFIDEAPQRLNKRDLNMFGRKWFQPEDASGLRKRIQSLLLEEFESLRLECGRGEGLGHDCSSEADEELSIKSS